MSSTLETGHRPFERSFDKFSFVLEYLVENTLNTSSHIRVECTGPEYEATHPHQQTKRLILVLAFAVKCRGQFSCLRNGVSAISEDPHDRKNSFYLIYKFSSAVSYLPRFAIHLFPFYA